MEYNYEKEKAMNDVRFQKYLDQFGNVKDTPYYDDARCMVKYFCYENNDFSHMSDDRLRRVALWLECLKDYKPNLYKYYSNCKVGAMQITLPEFKESLMFEICERFYKKGKAGLDISNYLAVLLENRTVAEATYKYFIENGGL